MATLGLVTVLFKTDNVLEGFFKSLSIQSYNDYNLYIIDNSPNDVTDRLITDLTSKFPIKAYTHIKNETNVGVAEGNNQGIRLSVADGSTHTILLNNDIEFYQISLLHDMIKCAIEQNEHLIVPKIFFFNSNILWMAGGKLIESKGICLHVGEGELDAEKYNKPSRFNYAPTCFMLINNNVFNNVGLMDPTYFVYYDDTDFLYRANKIGYNVYYMPSIEIFHKVSSSTGPEKESMFYIKYGNRNRIYFIRKNLKGFRYLSSMLYTLMTRSRKYFMYNSAQRKNLVDGMLEGFKM